MFRFVDEFSKNPIIIRIPGRDLVGLTTQKIKMTRNKTIKTKKRCKLGFKKEKRKKRRME